MVLSQHTKLGAMCIFSVFSLVGNTWNSAIYSLQKNEVLVLLEQLDSKTFECQAGNAKGTVQASHMKIITPLTNLPYNSAPQVINIDI